MNDRHAGGASHSYVLGHSGHEIDRLKAQARLIDPITQRFFREAGVGRGMRVLDVGSGAGDVAFLAADLVGDEGEVVGVDRVAAALDIASARAAERSLRHVSFHAGDPAEMTFERPFDAVIGRYVLQFQREPAHMLRRLATHVRPGGLVVFHEIDWSGLASSPPAPTFDRCCRWGLEAMQRHGTETHMGLKLHATFVAAGLGSPHMRVEAMIGGGANGTGVLSLVSGLMETLLPEMERFGVATAADVGLETLVERMSAEGLERSSCFVGHYQVAAWSIVDRSAAAAIS